MAGNTLIQIESPKTQSVDGVKSLLACVGRASDPLPTDVSLDNGRLVLVLSNKKDCFYVVTAAACSCPAAHWNRGPCKHMRKYFPQEAAKPVSSPSTPREAFRPFDTLPSEERRAMEAA